MNKKLDKILSWGRYLHWSDIYFRQYYKDDLLIEDNSKDQMKLFSIVSQWLASLYVVIEGWQKLGEKDGRIEKILNICPKYLELLRRYRNAVYHYQPTLFDERFAEFTKEGSAPVFWAVALELEFQRFLWEWPKKLIGTKEELDEIRDNIAEMIGWMPSDIIIARKQELEKIKKQAIDLLAMDDNKDSLACKELKDAIDIVEKVLQTTTDIPLKDIIDKIKNESLTIKSSGCGKPHRRI